MDLLFLLGRLLYGGMLIWAGYNHFVNVPAMSGWTAAKGVPAAKAAVLGTGALLVLGGLSIVLGLWVPVGVVLLLVFFVPVTWKMHAFWADTDPQARGTNRAHFLKNTALAGAALMFLAIPQPWPYALAG